MRRFKQVRPRSGTPRQGCTAQRPAWIAEPSLHRAPPLRHAAASVPAVLSMVAVVPEPPLLVPELATGATAETAALRAACREAARRLAASTSTWIAVGTDGGGRRTVGSGARGSFVGFGVDVVVGLGPDATDPVDAAMPLPLLVAGWLREGLPVTVRGELVAPDAAPSACLALGAQIAREATAPSAADPAALGGHAAALSVGDAARAASATAPSAAAPAARAASAAALSAGDAACAASAAAPSAGDLAARAASATEPSAAPAALSGPATALLVIGDGAATHTEKAPGYLDERAGPFDDAVAAALAAADPAALAALDPVLAAELWVAGRAPWQVLAGATEDGTWTGELLHSSRPFGVGYHVAVWQRCG